MTDRRMREGTFNEEQRTRFTTLALKRNLGHIRWREEHPYGVSNAASVGLQLAATLLLWIATSPLEQAMKELDRTRSRRSSSGSGASRTSSRTTPRGCGPIFLAGGKLSRRGRSRWSWQKMAGTSLGCGRGWVSQEVTAPCGR